jgi:hypothetical protein
MQELMLSYKRIIHYCSFLEHHGLISYDLTSHTYSIMPRGEEVLRLSQELAEYLLPVDQMIRKYSFYIQGQYYSECRSNNKNAGKPSMAPQHVH